MKTPNELLERLRGELGAAPEDDPYLAARIESALARIRGLTSRWLWPQAEFVDTWSPAPASVRAPLRQWPAESIQAVEVNGEALDLELQPVKLDLMGTNVLGLPLGAMEISIRYTAGYVQLPADLYELIKSAVSAALRDRGSEAGIKKVQVVDVGSIEYGSGGGWYSDGTAGADPILGPLVAVLDQHEDYASAHVEGRVSIMVREVSHG